MIDAIFSKRWLVLPTLALAQSPLARAQSTDATVSDTSSEQRVSTGYSLLAGLYPAYLTSKAHDSQNEGSRDGLWGGGAIYLSGIGDYLILDAGAGWFYSRIQGDDPKKESATSQGTESAQVHYVGTTAGYGDVGVRFRYRDLHLGPQVLFLFGEDTSYAPTMGSQKANAWVGAQLGWMYRSDSTEVRFAVRYDTDITIRDRQVSMIGLQAQFGIPFGMQKVTRTVVKERIQYRERVEEKKVEVVKFLLGSELVNFETDRDTLLPDSRVFLENLGKLLGSKRGMWKALMVEGHTDARGPADRNMDLSQRRARAVAGVLTTFGAPREAIQVQGFGSSKPLDPASNPIAWARNRRVELHFVGVTNQVEFMDELNRVKLLSRKPETCTANQCR